MEDQLRLSMAALEEENKRYKQLLQNAGITSDASSLLGNQEKVEAKNSQPVSNSSSLFVSTASSCDAVDQLLDVSLDASGLFSLSPLPMTTGDVNTEAALDSSALAGWSAAVSQAVDVTSLLTINTSAAMTSGSIDALGSFDVASALVEDGLLSPDFMKDLVGDGDSRPTEQEIRELDELAASVSQEERDAVNIDAVLQDIAAATENCDLLLNPEDVMLNMNLSGLGSDGCLNQALLPPASGSALSRENTAVTNSVSFASPIMTTGVMNDVTAMVPSGMSYTSLGMIGPLATQSGQSLGSLQGTLVLQANGQLLLLPSAPVPAMMPSTSMPTTPLPAVTPVAQNSSTLSTSGFTTASSVASSVSDASRSAPYFTGSVHPNSYVQSAVAAANFQMQQLQHSTNRVITVNTPNGAITMNTKPSQPNQLPSALILPSGQIVPVVTQPSTMFGQRSASVSSGPLLGAPNLSISQMASAQQNSIASSQYASNSSNALMSHTGAASNSASFSAIGQPSVGQLVRPGLSGMPGSVVIPSVASGGIAQPQRPAGLPQTLQAIITPEGNIILTLPPSAPVSNTPAALPVPVPPTSSTPPAKLSSKSKSGSATALSRKASGSNCGAAANKANAAAVGGGGGPRALMPKPIGGGGSLAKLAPNTSGNGSTPNSATPMASLGLLNDANQAAYSSPLATASHLSMSALDASIAAAANATDILAQAAESIFLGSPSGLSSDMTGGFYSSFHDDSGLQMDTSLLEADDSEAPKKSKAKPKKKATKKPNVSNSFSASGTLDKTSSTMYMTDPVAYQNAHSMLMSDQLDSSGLLCDYMKDDFADINEFADLIKINVTSMAAKADLPNTTAAVDASLAMSMDQQQQDACEAVCDADMEALARLWSTPEQPVVVSCSQPPSAVSSSVKTSTSSSLLAVASSSSVMGSFAATTVTHFAVSSISELFSKNVAIPMPATSTSSDPVKPAEVNISVVAASQPSSTSSNSGGDFKDSHYGSILSPTTGLLTPRSPCNVALSDSNICDEKTERLAEDNSDDDFCSPSQLYLSKGYSSRGSVSFVGKEKSHSSTSSSAVSPPTKTLTTKPGVDSAKSRVRTESKRLSDVDDEADLFQSSVFNDLATSPDVCSDNDELKESIKLPLNNKKEEAEPCVARLESLKVDDVLEEPMEDTASDHEFIVEVVKSSKKKSKAGKGKKATVSELNDFSSNDNNVSSLGRKTSGRRKSTNCKVDEVAVEVPSETCVADSKPAVDKASVEKKIESVKSASDNTAAEVKADTSAEISPLMAVTGSKKVTKSRGWKKKNDLTSAFESTVENDDGILFNSSSLPDVSPIIAEQPLERAAVEEVKFNASDDPVVGKARGGRRRDSIMAAVVEEPRPNDSNSVSERNRINTSFENDSGINSSADDDKVALTSEDASVHEKQTAGLETEQIETIAKPNITSKSKVKKGRKGKGRGKRCNVRRKSAASHGTEKINDDDEMPAALNDDDIDDDAAEPLTSVNDDSELPIVNRDEKGVEELHTIENRDDDVENLQSPENDAEKDELHVHESDDENVEPLTVADGEESNSAFQQDQEQAAGATDLSAITTKLKVCTVDLVDVMGGVLTAGKSKKKNKSKSKGSKSKKKRKLNSGNEEVLTIDTEVAEVEETKKVVPPLRIVSPVKISCIASFGDVLLSDNDNVAEEEAELVDLPSLEKENIADIRALMMSKSRKRKHTFYEETAAEEVRPESPSMHSATTAEETIVNTNLQASEEKENVRESKESKKSKHRKRRHATAEDQERADSERKSSNAKEAATNRASAVEQETNADDKWVQNNQQLTEVPKPPPVVLKVLKSAFAPKSSKLKSKKAKGVIGGSDEFDVFDFDSSENIEPLPALHRKSSVVEEEQLLIEPIKIKKKSPKKKKKKKRSRDRSLERFAADECAPLCADEANSPLPFDNSEDNRAAAFGSSKPPSPLSNCCGSAPQSDVDENSTDNVAAKPVEIRRVAPMRLPKNVLILPPSPTNDEDEEMLHEPNDDAASEQPESPAYEGHQSTNFSPATSPAQVQEDDSHSAVPCPAQRDNALDASLQSDVPVGTRRLDSDSDLGNLNRRSPPVALVEQQRSGHRCTELRDHVDRNFFTDFSHNLSSQSERLSISQQDCSTEAVVRLQHSPHDDSLSIKRPRRLLPPDQLPQDSAPTDYSLHRHSPHSDRKLPSNTEGMQLQHRSMLRHEEDNLRLFTDDGHKSAPGLANKTGNSSSRRNTSRQSYDDDQSSLNHSSHQPSSKSSKSSSKSSAKKSGHTESASSRFDSLSVYDQPPTYYPPIGQLSPPLPSDVASPFFAANLFAANKAAADIVSPFMFPQSHLGFGLGHPAAQSAVASHFGLGNIFSEMNGGTKTSENPIKFPSQASATDRGQLSSAAMLQNAAAAMSLFGHAAHSAGFDRLDRPLPTAPLPAHLTGSKHSSFGMPLNFAMRDR